MAKMLCAHSAKTNSWKSLVMWSANCHSYVFARRIHNGNVVFRHAGVVDWVSTGAVSRAFFGRWLHFWTWQVDTFNEDSGLFDELRANPHRFYLSTNSYREASVVAVTPHLLHRWTSFDRHHSEPARYLMAPTAHLPAKQFDDYSWPHSARRHLLSLLDEESARAM